MRSADQNRNTFSLDSFANDRLRHFSQSNSPARDRKELNRNIAGRKTVETVRINDLPAHNIPVLLSPLSHHSASEMQSFDSNTWLK
jgi:hypothetical protein